MFTLLKDTVREFLDDRCTTLAAAISYYTVFALPPVLVLILTTVGVLVDPADVQSRITSEVGELVGTDAAAMVGTMIRDASMIQSGPTALIGIAALLFGATGAFIQLQYALNLVWDVPKHERRGGVVAQLLKRVLSLGMILGIGFLLLLSMVLTTLVTAFGGVLAPYMPAVLSGPLLRVLEIAVSLFLITVLFAAIFKVMPDVNVEWRDALVGALFTAVLFVIGRTVIGLYLGRSEPGSAYGAAGALAAILVWIYYSAIIALLGAEFTHVWSRRHGRDPVASQHVDDGIPVIRVTGRQ